MIFLDSNFFISFFVNKDSRHKQSKNFLQKNSKARLISSNNVMLETLNWASKKLTASTTYQIGQILLSGKIAKIIDLENNDKAIALEIIKKFKDQQLSYVDATSFALIQRLKIKKIFSYDSDFNMLKTVENLTFQNDN